MVEAINLSISLCQSATLSARLLKHSLELMQVEVGLDIPVIEANYKKCGHLATFCRIQSLWEATSSFGITLNVPRNAQWTSSRTNNVTIIQKAYSLKIFNNEVLQD